MLTRSIRFKNFSGKKNKILNKKLINIFKSENWLTKYPLLNSLNKVIKIKIFLTLKNTTTLI